MTCWTRSKPIVDISDILMSPAATQTRADGELSSRTCPRTFNVKVGRDLRGVFLHRMSHRVRSHFDGSFNSRRQDTRKKTTQLDGAIQSFSF